MNLPGIVLRALRSAKRDWAHFGRDQRGATAVEFGLIALPFIGLMMAILETAVLYFAGQNLDTAVSNASRLIRTGQAQQQSMTLATFRQTICDQLDIVIDCINGLQLDVKIFTTFDSISLTPPIDKDGKLTKDTFTFAMGKGGDIVVVRAYYEWPTFSKILGLNFSNLSDGNHLLAATAAFKNEPFPW